MNKLNKERNMWRKQMEDGTWEDPYILALFRANRESDLWRSSRAVEMVCEYVLYLEEQLNKETK